LDQLDLLDFRDHKAKPGKEDLLVPLGYLGNPDRKDLQDLLDRLVQLETKVHQEPLDRMVSLGQLVRQDSLDNLVFRVLQVTEASPELEDQMAHQDYQVKTGAQDHGVSQDKWVLWVLQVLLGVMASLVKRANKVLQGIEVHRDCQGRLEPLVQMASQEALVEPDNQVRQGSQETVVIGGSQADPAWMAHQVHPVVQVLLVLLEREGLQDYLAAQAHKGSLVLVEKQARQGSLGHQVRMDEMDPQELLAK
jgi:hypothetical protein